MLDQRERTGARPLAIHPRDGELQTDRRQPLLLSNQHALIDLDTVHGFLSTCYWSPGIARERLARAIDHSMVWGVYDTSAARRAGADPQREPAQAAFMRVVTDRATFAYLCDVFVLEPYRGRGISRWMLEHIHVHPALRGIRRFSLLTRDAHGLYAKFGFAPAHDPARYMERVDKHGYTSP